MKKETIAYNNRPDTVYYEQRRHVHSRVVWSVTEPPRCADFELALLLLLRPGCLRKTVESAERERERVLPKLQLQRDRG